MRERPVSSATGLRRSAACLAASLVLALLAGCASTPSPSATPTASVTPTLAPLATTAPSSTLSPSATPAPTPSAPATSTDLAQQYELAVKLDFEAGQLDVVETLSITNQASAPINYLNLSVIPAALDYYTPQGVVKVDGREVASEFTNHTNLQVQLGRDLAPGAQAVVVVPFRLKVGDSGGVFGARLSKSGGILNLGEWFPILSRAHDAYGVGDPQVSYAASSIVLDLTSSASYSQTALAAPGVLRDFSGGNHWRYELTNARDYAFAFSPDFRLSTTEVGQVSVELFSVQANARTALVQMAAALEQYSSAYGTYPWARFVMAETSATGFSMEFPGLVLMGRDLFNTAAIWHETAHEWWYAQVGNDQLTDPFLDEALASFSARHFLGMSITSCSKTPIDEPATYWPAGLTTGSWSGCDGYLETVYHRGAVLLEAIRVKMGNTAFFAALRTFVAERRYAVVSNIDLLRALNTAAGGSLGSLYHTYLTSAGAAAALR